MPDGASIRIALEPGFAVMSTIDAAFELPHAGPLSALRPPERVVSRERGPWGFWASLGWGLFAIASGLFATVVCTGIWMLTHQLHVPDSEDAAFGTTIGMVALVVPVAVLGIAVKIRKFSLRDYFAVSRFARRDFVLGVICLTVLIAVFGAIETLLGFDAGSKSVEATYRAAKLAGVLPLLWLAMVVVAPVTEELMFRGFLHRGWAPSWLGVSGTILVTSALWAALHQQYNWLGICCVFLMGLIFGWMRQRSASTTLTIVLHALNNLFATVIVTLQVEWMS